MGVNENGRLDEDGRGISTGEPREPVRRWVRIERPDETWHDVERPENEAYGFLYLEGDNSHKLYRIGASWKLPVVVTIYVLEEV